LALQQFQLFGRYSTRPNALPCVRSEVDNGPGRTALELNDELCLCFHVTKRKVVNYIRVEKPRRAAQLSECFGAGTGCGWCRPFLQKLFDQAVEGGQTTVDLPTSEDYARMRGKYVRAGGGKPPPGATPVADDE
jgi:bacterioferritin-associated ferredoxin